MECLGAANKILQKDFRSIGKNLLKEGSRGNRRISNDLRHFVWTVKTRGTGGHRPSQEDLLLKGRKIIHTASLAGGNAVFLLFAINIFPSLS